MFPEPSSNDPQVAHAFHAWAGNLVLFLAFLAVLLILTWCWNRHLRPVDRGSIMPWPLLIAGYGLLLLLRLWQEAWPQAVAITAGLLIAGLLSRSVHPRGLWVPAMLIAALIGMGLHLSALLLFLITMVALLIGSERSVR